MEWLLTTATRLVELNGSKLRRKYRLREGIRKSSRKEGRKEREGVGIIRHVEGVLWWIEFLRTKICWKFGTHKNLYLCLV